MQGEQRWVRIIIVEHAASPCWLLAIVMSTAVCLLAADVRAGLVPTVPTVPRSLGPPDAEFAGRISPS